MMLQRQFKARRKIAEKTGYPVVIPRDHMYSRPDQEIDQFRDLPDKRLVILTSPESAVLGGHHDLNGPEFLDEADKAVNVPVPKIARRGNVFKTYGTVRPIPAEVLHDLVKGVPSLKVGVRLAGARIYAHLDSSPVLRDHGRGSRQKFEGARLDCLKYPIREKHQGKLFKLWKSTNITASPGDRPGRVKMLSRKHVGHKRHAIIFDLPMHESRVCGEAVTALQIALGPDVYRKPGSKIFSRSPLIGCQIWALTAVVMRAIFDLLMDKPSRFNYFFGRKSVPRDAAQFDRAPNIAGRLAVPVAAGMNFAIRPELEMIMKPRAAFVLIANRVRHEFPFLPKRILLQKPAMSNTIFVSR